MKQQRRNLLKALEACSQPIAIGPVLDLAGCDPQHE
jgi:hypothetical protein